MRKLFSLAVGIAVSTFLLCTDTMAAAVSIPNKVVGNWFIQQDLGAARISAMTDRQVYRVLGSTIAINDKTCKNAGLTMDKEWMSTSNEETESVILDCAFPNLQRFGVQFRSDTTAVFLSNGHYFLALKEAAGKHPRAMESESNMIMLFSREAPVMTFQYGYAHTPVVDGHPEMGSWLVSMNRYPGELWSDGHQASVIQVDYSWGSTATTRATTVCPVFVKNGRPVAGPCRDDLLGFRIESARFVHNSLILHGLEHAQDDPACCNTLKRHIDFRLRGTGLAYISEESYGRVGHTFASAADVANRIDVTSFPSSLGPRRVSNKITFSDYGFQLTDDLESSAILLDQKGHWRFIVTVLNYGHDDEGDNVLVCLEDKNLSGSYYSLTPLLFHWSPDGQMLRGTIAASTQRCPRTPPE